MRQSLFSIACAALVLTACNQTQEETMNTTETKAPDAEQVAHELEKHGDVRVDEYYWMKLSDEQKNAEEKDEQTQKVLDYLNSENDYTKSMLASTEGLQKSLYDEIVARIDPTDQSVPVKVNGYWYYSRYEEGKEYPFYCRKEGSQEADEQIMLNGPEMAKDHAYFAIGGRSVSEDNKLLVYGVDTVSRRQYTLYVKNLETGETLSDKIENTTGGATWANDNKTLFYTVKDPQTLRSYRIYKHKLGTPQSEDELVFEETDETYSTFVYKTKSRDFLVIGSFQTLASEYRILSANDPDGEWKVFEPRQRDHEYRIAHYDGDFYVVTNWGCEELQINEDTTGRYQ